MSVGYGLVFVVLAALSALTAVLASEWSLLPLRVAGAAATFSFLLVAVAYFGARPRVLLKRANGRRHPIAWLVHWPFFALIAFSYRLSILITREQAHAGFDRGTLIHGRRLTEREAEQAITAGWASVLDLVAEMPEATSFRGLANYRSLPVLDATAMTLDQLRDAVEWVGRQPGPVFVHCALGYGRSGTVVAACLLARGLAADPKAAVKQLRELRPGVRLNRAQRKVLSAFAEELAHSSGS